MRRAYRFRVYPATGQASRLTQCLRDHQRLYNAALEERREAWRMRRVTIRYGQQSAQLKEIRRADPDQGRWSFSSQQATLRRLDKAFQAFYRRCKTGQNPGYPRFKAVDRWDSVEWPSDASPRYAKTAAAGLAAAQQALARKRRGSANRRCARAKVAEVHRRIRHRRADFHHKTALALVRECGVIALEDLRIGNMTRSAAGTLEEPGTNVAAKSGLNPVFSRGAAG